MKPETLAIHAGYEIDPKTGALTPPMHLSTTFERDADGAFSRGYAYTREANPNRSDLEARLAALEGGAMAAAFSSGSAAWMTLLQALRTGDHLIAPHSMYFGVKVLIRDIFGDWGLQTTFVDMLNLDEVQAAVQPNTRLVIIETPSNPRMLVTDIAAVAAIAHQAGALLAVDNTIASPLFQRPLELGADLVVHATTKYLSGHSDVLGGVVIAAEGCSLFERIRKVQHLGGAVPSAFDCWLTLRGLLTLPYRMHAINQHALMVAQYLTTHPNIEDVLHVGLDTHPHYELAKRQMTGAGGLFSILVRGGRAEAMNVAAKVRLFIRATSFGGAHSTLEHRASIEDPSTGTPENLLRMSIGLEHPDDLIADLAQALE
jgi:cystathionine gamma-synthase